MMNLNDVVCVLGSPLIITKHDKGVWVCDIDNAEIKGDGVLHSIHERGISRSDVLKNFAKNISGKTIVMNAYKSDRKEISLPDNISPQYK